MVEAEKIISFNHSFADIDNEMKNMRKPSKKVVFTSLGILLAIIAIVVAALTVFGKQISAIVIPATPEERITSVAPGKWISETVEPERQIISLVAPPTEEWWDKVKNLHIPFKLNAVEWADFPQQPTSLGYSLTRPAGDRTSEIIGIASIYLSYDTPQSALTAADWFNSTELNSDQYYYASVQDNIVLISPSAIYYDAEFNLDNYVPEESTEYPTDKAYLTINFTSLGEQVKSSLDETQKTLYDDSVKSLGFNLELSPITWSGESSDGEQWSGAITEGAWSNANLAPSDYTSRLTESRLFVPINPTTDDSLEEGSVEIPDGGVGGDRFGYFLPGQSLMQEYTKIELPGEAYGTMRETSGEYTEPEPLEAGADIAKISVNANAWFQLMGATEEIVAILGVDQITFEFSLDSSQVDVSLTYLDPDNLSPALPEAENPVPLPESVPSPEVTIVTEEPEDNE